MQYEKPDLEIILVKMDDVITLSTGVGDGKIVDGESGGWS